MDAKFLAAVVIAIIALVALFARGRYKVRPFSEPKPDLSTYEIAAWRQRKEQHEAQNDELGTFRRISGWVAGVSSAFALFLFILSLFVIVGTNKVGIMTAFGKPQQAHSNGFHPKAPWAMKTEFDGTRQFLRFNGKGNNEEDLEKKEFPCIQVKLDGQAKACLSGVIAWQMRANTDAEKKNAVELFKTYRTFERLTENFVFSSSRKALGEVFAVHNPLLVEKNQTLGELNKLASDRLNQEFSGELNIMSVDLAVPDYDDETDKAIATMQAQKAKTALAEEELKTNEAKALANKALEESLKNPAVNQANCLQISRELGLLPGVCMLDGNSVILDSSGAVTKK